MEGNNALGVGDGLLQALLGYLLTIGVAIAVAALIWVIVAGLGRMRVRQQQRAAPPPVAAEEPPVPEYEEALARHVAAVAAAVYAVAGRGEVRLVHIGEAASAGAWHSTGRTVHQASHRPRR